MDPEAIPQLKLGDFAEKIAELPPSNDGGLWFYGQPVGPHRFAPSQLSTQPLPAGKHFVVRNPSVMSPLPEPLDGLLEVLSRSLHLSTHLIGQMARPSFESTAIVIRSPREYAEKDFSLGFGGPPGLEGEPGTVAKGAYSCILNGPSSTWAHSPSPKSGASGSRRMGVGSRGSMSLGRTPSRH